MPVMCDFRPFRAWRYNLKKIKFSDVIAPPYDVISAEAQDRLYARSPQNCIRLILNKKEAGDSETHNGYLRARQFFQEWRSGGVLTQDSAPCFSLYRQTFSDPADGDVKTRTAILGRIRLEPFEKGIVIAHEKTLSKPKEDRRKLLEATRTNFSPVFGLYEDTGREILGSFGAVLAAKPDYEGVDDDGVRQEVWVLRDSATVARIQKAFSEKKIYIADGHHRYQTALDHSRRVREAEGVSSAEELPSDFVLMALVEMSDPGLVLMSTHRMILPFTGFDSGKAVCALEPFFRTEAMTSESILARLKEPDAPAEPSMGLLFSDGRGFLLTLRDLRKAMEKMGLEKPELWCGLDVSLVSHLILGKLWGLPESEWEGTIRYTHSASEAVRKAASGEFAAVFLLKDPPVRILRDMGAIGELLPQKTTYFYPKLASGLVFYHHCKGDYDGNQHPKG
ncbi:MAG: DUF1015 domain-containing protein [Candidatus Omnitrophota bacterium]